jgi:hypothetical protein
MHLHGQAQQVVGVWLLARIAPAGRGEAAAAAAAAASCPIELFSQE